MSVLLIQRMLSSNKRCRSCLRKALKALKARLSSHLSQLEDDLEAYWKSLPIVTICRDLTTSSSLFRSNIHLALTFHLTHVFIGRSLIIGFLSTVNTSTERDGLGRLEIQTKVLSNCILSALEIIYLCQTLQDTVGFARASYTEFTTCRAALLVLLAQRVCERSPRLESASTKGIELIKHIALGLYTASSEKSAIQAMQIAIERLDDQKVERNGQSRSAYDRFCEWARLWNPKGIACAVSVTQNPAFHFSETYDTYDFASPWPFEPFPSDIYSSSPTFPENE